MSAGNHKDEGSLGTPLFDESASARARPVEPIHQAAEPIHQNSFNVWRGPMGSMSTFLGNQTRALAIAVVIGLITGAVGGLLLVNAAKGDGQEVVDTLAISPASELSPNESQNLNSFASQLSMAVHSSRPAIKRKARGHFRSNRPRAYRVAIIR